MRLIIGLTLGLAASAGLMASARADADPPRRYLSTVEVPHPAYLRQPDDPARASASVWREGCDDGLHRNPTVWLLTDDPYGQPVYRPDIDPAHPGTELAGPVTCRWPHTAEDRAAFARELEGVTARDRWYFG